MLLPRPGLKPSKGPSMGSRSGAGSWQAEMHPDPGQQQQQHGSLVIPRARVSRSSGPYGYNSDDDFSQHHEVRYHAHQTFARS